MSRARIFTIESTALAMRHRVRRRRSIIHEFGMNTSTHGIPGIARSQSPPNTLFWSICFATFAAITIYFVYREIRAFFDYETQTSVSVVSEWPQLFPAFTICNIVPVRLDRFIEPFLAYVNAVNGTGRSASTSIASVEAKYIGEFLQVKINRNESVDDFFYPLNAMLIRCVFNGRSCSALNFTSFLSSSYGRCYTFNAKLKETKNVRFSDEYGGPGNLNLRLYVHSHQYVPYIREGTCTPPFERALSLHVRRLGVGMIGMVHDNVQLPTIDLSGLALATGNKHRITYTKKSVSYLRRPYTTCTDKVPPMMQAMFDNYQGAEYEYSEDICYELCMQVYT